MFNISYLSFIIYTSSIFQRTQRYLSITETKYPAFFIFNFIVSKKYVVNYLNVIYPTLSISIEAHTHTYLLHINLVNTTTYFNKVPLNLLFPCFVPSPP